MEVIKGKINSLPFVAVSTRINEIAPTGGNKTLDHTEDKGRDTNERESNVGAKRNSQPFLTPMEKKDKNKKKGTKLPLGC